MLNQPILITGNQHKADYFAKWIGAPVEHRKIDLDEIQSLDLRTVVEHKARQAFAVAGRPVLVEDVALTFTAMGRLPGTFIKWFLEELGTDGLCHLADSSQHRSAEVAIMYAYFDGKQIEYFEVKQTGTIAETPRGNGGFGWNAVFIPDGATQTYGEMDEDTYRKWNIRAQVIDRLKYLFYK